MAVRNAYQITFKIHIKNERRQDVNITGIVLATEQAIAVETAKKALQEIIDADKVYLREFKLVSVKKMLNNFFLIAEDELEKQVSNK